MTRIIVTLALLLCASAAQAQTGEDAIRTVLGNCGDPCVITYNPGGSVANFFWAGDAIRKGGRKWLVIDGFCASACVTLADRARPHACITRRATFGVHRTSLNHLLPLSFNLRKYVREHGGAPKFGGSVMMISNDVAGRFWRRCTLSWK